jgi:hypothetical protein
MSFESMSFGEAVRFVNFVGLLINVLLLSVPVGAIYAIFRGRSNRPTARSLFPHVVLWGWVLLLIGAVVYIFTGAWYGEGGPPPQKAAAQTTLTALGVMVCVAAIHIGLYLTTRPRTGSE